MVLPSQTGRQVRRRRTVHQRPRQLKLGRAVIASLFVLAVFFAALKLLPGEGDPAQETLARPVSPSAAAPDPEATDAGSPLAIEPETPVTATAGETAAAAPPPRGPTPPRTPAPDPVPSGPRTTELMEQGLALADANRPVEARRVLTAALAAPDLSPSDAEFVRDALSSLNRRLVFSPEVVPGDPFSRVHMVGAGERLVGIVRDQSLQVDWRLILRVNMIASERHLRAGQRLKLLTGPFHAVVDKSDFRLDLYLGDGPERVYVASLPVGLGEYGSTPIGGFRVKKGSKLVNPSWANPRTGERFGRDDPANPIGEHWIGLEGDDDLTRQMTGYGIHGTIEPDTIGREASMGCVRMRPEDVALVYEMLMEGVSRVEIRE